MKFYAIACLVGFFVCVTSENCSHGSDCQWTKCDYSHGWWLHCIQGSCSCTHDTYTGAPCPSGQQTDCTAAHGNRCMNIGGAFHCFDNVCHCVRPNTDIGQ